MSVSRDFIISTELPDMFRKDFFCKIKRDIVLSYFQGISMFLVLFVIVLNILIFWDLMLTQVGCFCSIADTVVKGEEEAKGQDARKHPSKFQTNEKSLKSYLFDFMEGTWSGAALLLTDISRAWFSFVHDGHCPSNFHPEKVHDIYCLLTQVFSEN